MSQVFEIRLESDLSEFTSTVTDGGDLSWSADAALAGSAGGMSLLIDDTVSIYGEKDFTQLTSNYIRTRFYLDPNGLTMASGDIFNVLNISGSGNKVVDARLRYDGANYDIQARIVDDASSAQGTSFYDITDAEHYLEILVEYASSAVASDAKLTFWIDGVQKEQIVGVDLYDRPKADRAQLGAVTALDAGTSGTFYMDEFVLRDDNQEIGPVASVGAAMYHHLQQMGAY